MTGEAIRVELRNDSEGFRLQMLRARAAFIELGAAANLASAALIHWAHAWGDSRSRGAARARRRELNAARAAFARAEHTTAWVLSMERPERSAMHAAYRRRARRR